MSECSDHQGRQRHYDAKQREKSGSSKCEYVCHLALTSAGRLTVNLRGRTTTPDRRYGPTISTGSRRANQTTPHGPLQRLLEGSLPRICQVPWHCRLQQPHQHWIHELVLIRDIEAYQTPSLKMRLIFLQEAVSV